MTRTVRISVELLAPPLLGSSPFLLMAIITGAFSMIPAVLLVAYLAAIVPNMVFTGLMELAFSWGLDPRSPKAILLAGILGLAAGIAIGLLLGGLTTAERAVVFGLIGMIVGMSTALIVSRKSAPAALEARLPPSSSTP
jgi:hypothetical protein